MGQFNGGTFGRLRSRRGVTSASPPLTLCSTTSMSKREGVFATCHLETTAAHRSVYDHVARCCRGVAPKPSDMNSAGAVRELRGARSSYDSEVLAGRDAPIDLSLLSLPGEHPH